MNSYSMGFHRPAVRFAAYSLAFLLAVFLSLQAQAIEIKSVKSKGGIEAWLVEDYSVPIIAMNFAFEGGASQDPAGKDGLANLMSGTLDEGAGDMTSRQFQQRLEDLTMSLKYDTGRDFFYGSLSTLSVNKDDAFDMLRLSLTSPRFDNEPVERIKSQIVASIQHSDKQPGSIASEKLAAALFPDHPYGLPVDGTVETVEPLTSQDLTELHKRIIAKNKLKIAVVGAISEADLSQALDHIFGALPEKATLTDVADVKPAEGQRIEVPFDSAQTSIIFALPGVKRDDPDFVPAYIMNHILGGGTFSSWLYDEVREKRGLTYSIGSYLIPYEHSAVLMGSTSTKPSSVAEVTKLIEDQLKRMISKGPTKDELAKAKSYLTGSYALGFDNSSSIARRLVAIQTNNLGIDYVNTRNEMIEKVSMKQIRDVAKKLLSGQTPTIVRVGPSEKIDQ